MTQITARLIGLRRKPRQGHDGDQTENQQNAATVDSCFELVGSRQHGVSQQKVEQPTRVSRLLKRFTVQNIKVNNKQGTANENAASILRIILKKAGISAPVRKTDLALSNFIVACSLGGRRRKQGKAPLYRPFTPFC